MYVILLLATHVVLPRSFVVKHQESTDFQSWASESVVLWDGFGNVVYGIRYL